MSTIPVSMPGDRNDAGTLQFTQAAASRARDLIAEEGNPALKLRVYVDGGGCSGFQYGFRFDDTQADDDVAIEREGVTLLVDRVSLPHLAGATVDCAESLGGSQFVIHNPNARTTCGCGSSFTI